MDILITLNLPIHECSICFHLFVLSSISLQKLITFWVQVPWVHLNCLWRCFHIWQMRRHLRFISQSGHEISMHSSLFYSPVPLPLSTTHIILMPSKPASPPWSMWPPLHKNGCCSKLPSWLWPTSCLPALCSAFLLLLQKAFACAPWVFS